MTRVVALLLGVLGLLSAAACEQSARRPYRVINLVPTASPGTPAPDPAPSTDLSAAVEPKPGPTEIPLPSKPPPKKNSAKPSAQALLLRVTMIKGTGTISRDKVQARLGRLAQSPACRASGELWGSAKLVIKLKPDGGVGYVKLREGRLSPRQTRCLLGWAHGWRLGRPRGGTAYVTVSIDG